MYESEIFIRQASIEDLDSVLRNENLCYQFPWSKNMLKDCLLNQHFTIDANLNKYLEKESKYIFFVMLCEEQIIGHLIVQKVIDELHLHNVCVLPTYQGESFGQKWMNYLMFLAAKLEIEQIVLEVRESNLTAIHLYEKNGFRSIGCRKKYYQQSTRGEAENAVIFTWSARSLSEINI